MALIRYGTARTQMGLERYSVVVPGQDWRRLWQEIAGDIAPDAPPLVWAFSRAVIAKMAILAGTNGERGVAGQMVCPCCGTGALRYSVANTNGHILARCSTADCVDFLE